MAKQSRLDRAGVEQLAQTMSGYVERGVIPGAVTLVARGDDVQVSAVGTLATEGQARMQRDTIFRIASITKPIVAVATMMLVDDQKLRLEDSIEPWLPELADRRVLRSIEAELDDTVPAERAITVRDLLTFCFGFGSVLAPPGSYPIQRAIASGRLGGDGPEYLLDPPPADVWIRRLGELPLLHQPGERWAYNTAADVLGILIARVAGSSLEAFLRERLLGPLGMRDTSFHVPAHKRARLASCYRLDPETERLTLFDGAEQSAFGHPPALESGAGGLVSTVDDYYAFCRMMLDGGTCGHERIVSAASVAAMTRDQLTPAQRQGTELFFGQHASWGLGMSVDIRQENPWNVPGRFGWDGGFGTSAYSDPRNDFVGIMLTQCLMESPEPPPLYEDFWSHAYRSLAG